MSVPKDAQKRAIAAVSDVNPGACDYHVIHLIPEFLDGQLIVVEGRFSKDSNEKFTNQVYVSRNGVRVAKNPTHLAHLVAEEEKRPSPIAELVRGIGTAGLIAMIITITICYMLIVLKATDVPAILSTSLSTILGFYFGTKTTQHGSQTEARR